MVKPLVYNFSVRPCIILFAKAPVAGQVKTRLIGRLNASEAAALHTALVLDILSALRGMDADLELHTDILTDAWGDVSVTRRLQAAGHLGEKILTALRDALEQGNSRVMIVGSDTPALPISHVNNLLASTADVALGPSDDGGFYAISCRRVKAAMFEGVPWSTSDTLARTVEAIERCGMTVEIGASWWDVDTPSDLDRLRRQPDLGANTMRWLQWKYADPPVQR